jgi:hypothetical protein
MFDDSGESASIRANETPANIESELGKELDARSRPPEDLSGFKTTAYHQL